jgi:hypothetical protein
MLRDPNDQNFEEELNQDHVTTLITDSVLPGELTYSNYFLLRSNLPGLSLEIEKPDTELPVLTFDFKAS